jgi:opacity protein-like surface antigen
MKPGSIPSCLRGVLIASLLSVSCATLPAAWSLSLKAGVTALSGGDFHRGPAFDGSVLLGLPAGSLPVDVDAKGFDDVYDGFNELRLEAAYAASENLSYTLGLGWLSGMDQVLRVGTVAGTLPLNAEFSDYQDALVYGGVRYDFRITERWNPYVGAQLGYKRVDAITASFSVPNTPFNPPYQSALTDAKFYDASNVWSYGVVVGVEYKLTDRASVSLETGYLAQSALDDNDSVLGLLGLNALNDEGDLSYVPVRLSLTYHF